VSERPTRIDAFERELDDLIELLQFAKANVRDLHTLAYDRKIAASERVSASGPMHFYLDKHGDTHAREAMHTLMRAAKSAGGLIEPAARECKRILTAGDRPKAERACGPRLITASEHAETIAAKARRIARGEYEPHQNWPQPRPDLEDVALSSEQRKVARVALDMFAEQAAKRAETEADADAKARLGELVGLARGVATMIRRAGLKRTG
jgi:hypothetical protein